MEKKYFHRRGFTLVEVLVGSLLISALGIGILGFNNIITKNQTIVWRNFLNVEQANSNLLTLVRELRTARPGDNGAYPLESANDQEIIFYADIDFDQQSERVRYFLNGSSFYKGVTKPTGYPVSYPSTQEKLVKLTDYVRNNTTPIFYYYNGDWPADTVHNPLINPIRLSDTKLMRIFLRLNTQDNEPNADFILESYTQIRMLKNNL